MKPTDNNWHLSKSVSIGHIVTTALVLLSIVVYLGDIERNVSVNTVEIDNIKDSRDRNRARYDTMFERIEDKLDRLFVYITEQKG